MKIVRKSKIFFLESSILIILSIFFVGTISRNYKLQRKNLIENCTESILDYIPYVYRNYNELCGNNNAKELIGIYFFSCIVVLMLSTFLYINGRCKLSLNIWPSYYKYGLYFMFWAPLTILLIGGESRKLNANGLHEGDIWFYIIFSFVVPLSQLTYFSLYYDERK